MRILSGPLFFRIAIFSILGFALIASFFVIQSSSNKELEPVADSTAQIPSTDPIKSMFQSVNGVTGNEFDAEYIRSLLIHQAISTAMAEQVKDSTDKEVRDVAAYIKESTALNGEQLQTWAKTWGVPVREPSQKDIETILSNLTSNTGEERDHQFILDIIDHFSGSVTLSKLATSNSDRSELKEFANNVVTAETAQVEMLQEWAPTVGFDTDDRQSYSHNKHDGY